MFTKIAEKLGILDIVAPRTAQQDASGSQKRKRMTPQEARDEALARKLQAEEDRRFKMLKAQKEAEELAEKYSKYAKRQRVSYHHRGKDKYYDAIIVGVHLDDGPDNPYYVSDAIMKPDVLHAWPGAFQLLH